MTPVCRTLSIRLPEVVSRGLSCEESGESPMVPLVSVLVEPRMGSGMVGEDLPERGGPPRPLVAPLVVRVLSLEYPAKGCGGQAMLALTRGVFELTTSCRLRAWSSCLGWDGGQPGSARSMELLFHPDPVPHPPPVV
jgi:hypothetical protein